MSDWIQGLDHLTPARKSTLLWTHRRGIKFLSNSKRPGPSIFPILAIALPLALSILPVDPIHSVALGEVPLTRLRQETRELLRREAILDEGPRQRRRHRGLV